MQQHQQAVAAAQQKHAAASLRHAMSTNPAMATAENAARLRQLEVRSFVAEDESKMAREKP